MFLELNKVSKRFGEVEVLKSLSFSAKKGELIAVLGASGSGKTTLLKIIAGLLQPDSGEMSLNGKDLTSILPQRREIGYIPQSQALFPHMTVAENIAFGLKMRRWNRTKAEERVSELLILSELEDHQLSLPHELSGGQKQRVALMRAIAPFPSLLLMDEPLSSLDVSLRENLALFIRDFQQGAGITTIFVTHDVREAQLVSDRMIIISQGVIFQEDTPQNLINRPAHSEVSKILGMDNLYQIKEIEKKLITTPIGVFPVDKIHFTSNSAYVYLNPIKLQILSKEEEDFVHEGCFITSGELIRQIWYWNGDSEIILHISKKQKGLYLKLYLQNCQKALLPDKRLKVFIPFNEICCLQ